MPGLVFGVVEGQDLQRMARSAWDDVPVTRFNWEEAAKQDYVARHGSVSHRFGLGSDKDPIEEQEVALRSRLQSALSILDDYARLTAFEQQRHFERVYRQLCQRFDEERDRIRVNEPRLLERSTSTRQDYSPC